MATIEDFRKWYDRDLSRYGKWDDHVEVVGASGGGEYASIAIRIYTETHSFRISAHNPQMRKFPLNPPRETGAATAIFDPSEPTEERTDTGYLGCIASCRKPRAGEDWTRGSDLADGPLTEETWHAILGDILGYELVKIHRPKERIGDGVGSTPTVTA